MLSYKYSLVYAAIACSTVTNNASANNVPPVIYPSIEISTYERQIKNSVNNQSGAQSNGNTSVLGNTQMYVLPAPVSAANLPAFNCPLGDSLSFSIGWNFFSYARSSIRTEMECLDKTLAGMRALAISEPRLAPVTKPDPVCTVEYIDTPTFVITETKSNIPPKRGMTRRPVKTCR
jgi:hypothetical protein